MKRRKKNQNEQSGEEMKQNEVERDQVGEGVFKMILRAAVNFGISWLCHNCLGDPSIAKGVLTVPWFDMLVYVWGKVQNAIRSKNLNEGTFKKKRSRSHRKDL